MSRDGYLPPSVTQAMIDSHLENADNDMGYCDRCNNTRYIDCYCGGDLCVCENNGEMPCPHCDDAPQWKSRRS